MNFGSLKTKMKAFLRASKITDPDNTLSLTNVGVMVLLTKIALAPSIDWPTTATLLLSLLSYNYKKLLRTKEKAAEVEASGQIADIEKKIAELNQAFAVKSMLR